MLFKLITGAGQTSFWHMYQNIGINIKVNGGMKIPQEVMGTYKVQIKQQSPLITKIRNIKQLMEDFN